MAKNYYLPKDDSGKADRLDHFAAKLPQYATLLEISAADVSAVQADAALRHQRRLEIPRHLPAQRRASRAMERCDQRDGGGMR
ncbi:MAG: hypothetical protein PHE55_10775 [Methylococcaceae bacterium]|nr:hypothetical protein [Methylococcaceae bacterium]